MALSDVNGVLVERYKYDVYGAVTIYDSNGVEISESSVGNPYFFTGRRYDDETGLYYYRARYYSPDIGRFLQTDPIYYLAGLNLYTYCGNNPTNWIDPYGQKDFLKRAWKKIRRGARAVAEWAYNVLNVFIPSGAGVGEAALHSAHLYYHKLQRDMELDKAVDISDLKGSGDDFFDNPFRRKDDGGGPNGDGSNGGKKK